MPPPTGWTTSGTVSRVIDGDTIIITTTRTLRIRLLDCWAPESRTRDLDEKELGLASKQHMQSLADGKEVVVHIPTDAGGDVAEAITMGRVLGHVWLKGDDKSLSERQVEAGHATKEK